MVAFGINMALKRSWATSPCSLMKWGRWNQRADHQIGHVKYRINQHLFQAVPDGLSVPGAQPLATQQSSALTVTSGTGSDQADLKYVKSLTLVATPTVLYLTALADPFGGTVNFARVKSILIINTSTVSGQAVLMGYSTTTANAWTGFLSNPGQISIRSSTTTNQGVFLALAPGATAWPVSSTSKLLQLDPGANTIRVNVEIVGASA